MNSQGYSLGVVYNMGNRVLEKVSRFLIKKSLSRAGVPNAAAIFSHTRPKELETLLKFAQSCAKGAVGLEIGSYLGASSCYLGAGLKERGGRLYCLDTWNNETMPDGPRDTYAEFKSNTVGLGDTLIPLRKRSADLTIADLTGAVDFAFIDGDHSYEAVKADLVALLPCLKSEATIIFHDTVAFASVCRVLGELLGSNCCVLRGHVCNLSWIQVDRKKTDEFLNRVGV